MWANHARHYRGKHSVVNIEPAYKSWTRRKSFTRSEKWRLNGVNGLAIAVRNQNDALRGIGQNRIVDLSRFLVRA